MHERKRGTLKSGRSGKKVTSRNKPSQLGYSEARRAGGKVPSRKQKEITVAVWRQATDLNTDHATHRFYVVLAGRAENRRECEFVGILNSTDASRLVTSVISSAASMDII